MSQQMQFLSEILTGEKIPRRTLSFFRARLQSRLYDLVLSEFLTKSAAGLSKAEVARRIDRGPEQITRWLATPGNWTLETVSDLMLAISGAELGISVSQLADRQPRNYVVPDWVNQRPLSRNGEDKKFPISTSAATTTATVQVLRVQTND